MRDGEASQGVASCDAVTSATWTAPGVENADVAADDSRADCGAAPSRATCVREPQGADNPFAEDVQEVIDAVTGATWGTRNQIMEDVFHKRLDQDASSVPAFAPPGETL